MESHKRLIKEGGFFRTIQVIGIAGMGILLFLHALVRTVFSNPRMARSSARDLFRRSYYRHPDREKHRKQIYRPSLRTIESRHELRTWRFDIGKNQLDPSHKTLIDQGFTASPVDVKHVLAVEVNGRKGFRLRFLGEPNDSHPKYFYYLEGSAFEMGFQMGLLAARQVYDMTTDYTDNVVLSMAGMGGKNPLAIGNIITEMIYLMSRRRLHRIPLEMREEMYGMYLAVKKYSIVPGTWRILLRDLITLNYGIDTILSHYYKLPFLAGIGARPQNFIAPMACNAFILDGERTKDGHTLFGRDFMFATCDVFSRTGSYILYNPENAESWEKNDRSIRSFLSFAAPGFIGSVTGLNPRGLSMGVHLAAGRNVNRRQPGLNSLLLIRRGIESCTSIGQLTGLLGGPCSPEGKAGQGITNIYPLAQSARETRKIRKAREAREARKARESQEDQEAQETGNEGDHTGCIIEAGDWKHDSRSRKDFIRYLPRDMRRSIKKGLLSFPNEVELSQINKAAPYSNGSVIRYIDTHFPKFPLGNGASVPLGEKYNRALFEYFGIPGYDSSNMEGANGMYVTSDDLRRIYRTQPKTDDLDGFIVPSTFFFPPQREDDEHMLIATNHFISPLMRLFGMNSWIGKIQHMQKNDSESQWRYDDLNKRIKDRLYKKPHLDFDDARELIDYLRPFDPVPGGGYLPSDNYFFLRLPPREKASHSPGASLRGGSERLYLRSGSG
jgi:hypothetical protein